jgi:lipopolysaccharide/colanic/teichoic acid biosynthesis glycosyltransferase
MISDREKKIYHLFVGWVALGMLAYVCVSYGVMYWLRPNLEPAWFSYARFAGITTVSLLVEGWTRSAEWRPTPGRGLSRFRWYVTQRQWLWLAVSIGLILYFVRDMQISRGYILFVVLTSVPLLYASNRSGFPAFVKILTHLNPQWKVRYSLIGSDEWRQSVRENLHALGDVLEQGEEYVIGDASKLEEVVTWIEKQRLDLLVIPARQMSDAWVTRLLALGERRGFRCWIPLELSRQYGYQFNLQSIGKLNVLTPPSNPLSETCNRVLKRAFDISLALAIIPTVLLPLMFLVWCIHRLYSRGPLFFMQDRLGENGKIFRVIKFRTMDLHDECEGRQASASDPRVFKFGKLLRKLSVDEFPQFLNVLWGDMSVVGPRPHLEIHERRFEVFYERYGMRRFVKPGITGLAQICGYRGEIRTTKDVRGRARYDLVYVRNWSLSLDIKIVFQTGIQVIRPHRNAY